MSIYQSKARAVIAASIDLYGSHTIIHQVLPHITDINTYIAITLSILDWDREMWIRSMPIGISDPESDPNQMAYNVEPGIDVLITRTKMEGWEIVPRFEIQEKKNATGTEVWEI